MASGPLTRTTAIAPIPGVVEITAMVSTWTASMRGASAIPAAAQVALGLTGPWASDLSRSFATQYCWGTLAMLNTA